jgi:hypothetical protein
VVEISKSDQRDDTKSIGIQPVYYRKIEHKMESYNTCSIVIKKAEFGLKLIACSQEEIIEPMLLYVSYTVKFFSRDLPKLSFYWLRPK